METVYLATLDNDFQATLLSDLLRNDGIESFLKNEIISLLHWYRKQEVNLSVLAEFHARYECIHPFQDGNGRTGRLIIFRECLKNGLIPVIIEDSNRYRYLEALKQYREEKIVKNLVKLFEDEQQVYYDKAIYFM